MQNEDETQNRFERDQAETIHQNFLVSIFGVAIAAALIFALYIGRAPLEFFLPWTIFSLMTIIPRYPVIYGKGAGQAVSRNPRRFLRVNALFALFTSTSFSMWTFYNLETQDFSADKTLLIINIAYCAASVVTASAYPPIVLSVVVPIFVSFAISTLLSNQDNGIQQFLTLLTIFGVFLRVIRIAHRMFADAKRIKYDHEDLILELQRANEQGESARRRFEFLAHHDPLTGLNNRTFFNQELERVLAPDQLSEEPAALILIDIDHFKTVNDTLGHTAGDLLLEEAARRFLAYAPANSVVARLGGDEFAILCRSPEAGRVASETAGAILASNTTPVICEGRTLHLSTSIGIACAPDHATSPTALISCADIALYDAKARGRQQSVTYDCRLSAAAHIRRQLELDFPEALCEGRLAVFFQPQVSLDDCRVTGFEGLLRWQHPTLGAVSPPDIVTVAQALNMSGELNRFVLDRCIRMIATCRQAGIENIRVAANMSPRDIIGHSAAAMIAELLRHHAVEAGQLEIEITEETFLDIEAAREPLAALSTLGIRLAVDDFGVGYSSLAYLHQLKVDAIKIDKRFVSELSCNDSDRAIVSAMLAVGRQLGCDVVAEGVENAASMQALINLGCRHGQGYYFNRPMPEREVLPWLIALRDGTRTLLPRTEPLSLEAKA